MAVRYVKDFEFPAASGYTKSATPVTGQMLAKGGPAKGAPKGVMVVIGVGKPMKKAEGGGVSDADRLNQMFADAAAANDAERTMSGKSKAPMAKKAVPVAKRGSPYIPNTNIPRSEVTGEAPRSTYKNGGSAKHDDAAMDKALIKKMVRPEAMAGKVMKKAAGGAAIPPQMPLQGPPLQSMPAAVRAPAMGRARAPMVLGEPDAPRMAVNAKRPGGPNVGKLRARMAKAASMANPDSAPAMMKKGGKTNC